jgi:hypothetical protein
MMNSEKLSMREKQPGHDRSFVESEQNFFDALSSLVDLSKYEVINKPTTLKKCFSGKYGVVPEASIVNKSTGKQIFFEVKKQGASGNAEERAYKHHTVQFYKLLSRMFGYDYHPFVTVFCEHLSHDPKYTLKFQDLIEETNYCLWTDYNPEVLKSKLELWLAWID